MVKGRSSTTHCESARENAVEERKGSLKRNELNTSTGKERGPLSETDRHGPPQSTIHAVIEVDPDTKGKKEIRERSGESH